MDDKKCQSLIRDILVCLRGRFSQEQLARKLKLTSYQINRWEAGRARIRWSDFCAICSAVKSPIQRSLRRVLFIDGPYLDSDFVITSLTPTLTSKQLAKALNTSVSRVSRLKAKKAEFYLEDFLRLAAASPYEIEDFLGALCGDSPLHSLQDRNERRQRERDLQFSRPWVSALPLGLQTKQYQKLAMHSDSWFAERLGVHIDEVKQAFLELIEIGAVTITPNYKFQAEASHLTVGGGSFEGGRNIRLHWIEAGKRRLLAAQPGENLYFGYKVFAVSAKQKQEAEALLVKTYAELDAICKKQNSGGDDFVCVYTSQLHEVI